MSKCGNPSRERDKKLDKDQKCIAEKMEELVKSGLTVGQAKKVIRRDHQWLLQPGWPYK